MGFWKKEYCPICGKKIGFLNFRIKDKVAICPDCFAKMDIDLPRLKFQSIKDIKNHLCFRSENLEKFQTFNTSREIKIGGYYFREDDNLGLWYVSAEKKPKNPTLYNYEQIVDFKLLEDGDTISSGGLGRALVGGALFGGVGAIVGGVTGGKKAKNILTSLEVIITLDNPYKNTINVKCMPAGITCKSGSLLYKTYKSEANNFISFLATMSAKAKKTEAKKVKNSPKENEFDEIVKYKELLDKGVITEEEFALKKKELLGL